MNLPIILDLFVIICLAATIAFAIRLNKKLSTIYNSRNELQTFLNQFSKSMEKADAGIKDLRGIGESVFKTAQDQLKTAEALKSDLAFLNERGEDIAQSLDQHIREARSVIKEFETINQTDFQGIKDLSQKGAASGSTQAPGHQTPQSVNQDNPDFVRHLQNVR